ncbi:MAG: hypothetical protein WBO36_13765 [Saprospiraceae bacterium]
MNKLIILINSLCFIVLSGSAQQDTSKLILNQVEVIKVFEANLEEARKVQIKSVLPPQKDFSPKYKYDITIVPITLNFPEPQIKPLAMNPDAPFKINKGFVRAGYGFLKNPEIMAGYHMSKKDSYDAGIQVNFESLNNSSSLPFQKYRNSALQLYGTRLIKENVKIYGDIGIDTKQRYFYHSALNIDSLYGEINSKRSISGYHANIGLSNAEPTRFKINYDVSLGLRNRKITNEDARENGIAVGAKVEKIFRDNTVLSIDGNFDYSAFNGVDQVSLTTASLTPVFKTRIKKLIFNGGVNLLYSSDGNSAIFPELKISYGIVGNNLQAFAGVHQGYFTNNFTNISAYNPYLSTDIDTLRNSVFREFYGGIKGQFSFLTYQVKGGYKDVRDQMFLLNTQGDIRRFDMLYDDVGIVFISGNLDFAIKENITFGGWLTQNVFSLNTLANAWHIPNLEANAYVNVKVLNDLLLLRSELFLGNSVPFVTKDNLVTKSNVLFDFNLSAELKVYKNSFIFIKGINLFDNQYERWYGYPSVGINGMVGLQVTF